jgi:hypothetical protein
MATPDEPLGMTVHSMPSPEDAARRRSGRFQALMVLAVCAAPVVASYFTFYVVKPGDGAAAYGDLITPTRPIPEVTGRDLQGEPVALRDLTGQWLLVTVGDAACGEACERRLFMQRQLREMLGRESDRVDKLWLVADDAPVSAQLQEALAGTPAMHVVRLPRAQIAQWLEPAPGQVLDAHLYVVDPLGQWMMRQPVDPEPAKVKKDLDRLLRAAAGWDRAGRQQLVTQPEAPAAAASRP